MGSSEAMFELFRIKTAHLEINNYSFCKQVLVNFAEVKFETFTSQFLMQNTGTIKCHCQGTDS